MTFPDAQAPFFSLDLPDGRSLICLFGPQELIGDDPYPEFEIVAGIDDREGARHGNLRRDRGDLVLRLSGGDVTVPVTAVSGTAEAVDVDDGYQTVLAAPDTEPSGTRNLPSFYHHIHHASRRREHFAMLEFANAA